jgi:hypothetical protein
VAVLYRHSRRPYVPRRFRRKSEPMRAETESLVDEIKQAIALLRRHL